MTRHLAPGSSVGPWVLGRKVGGGQFGEVWTGRRPGETVEVALKIPLDPSLADRLRRAGPIQSRIASERVVRIIESDPAGDPPWLAMELVPGESLRAHLARGPLPVPLAVEVVRDVALALADAHRSGVIHRDLKPENVIVLPGASAAVRAKVTDFDLAEIRTPRDSARLRHSLEEDEASRLRGTVAYLAPEVVRGEEAGPRSDLYALGVLLFEALTGRLPAPGDVPSAYRAEAPRALDGIFRRLFVRAEQRFASADDVARELSNLLRPPDEPGSALRLDRLAVVPGPGGPRLVALGREERTILDVASIERMVPCPAGPFIFGSRRIPGTIERPFEVDVYPVTNWSYRRYVEATGAARPRTWPGGRYPEGHPFHPVAGISLDEARSYARWAGKRLPTEVEWERAARGTDGRRYPWGDAFERERANTEERGLLAATPVGTHPGGASPAGAHDMAGNVWEWTETHRGVRSVVRGGSFLSPAARAQTFYRGFADPGTRSPVVGFRCVRDT